VSNSAAQDNQILSEVQQTLAIIADRLEGLLKRADEMAMDIRASEAKFENRQKINDAQHIEIIKQLTKVETLRGTMETRIQSVEAHRDTFWVKVTGVSAAVAAVVAAIMGGIVFLIQTIK